VSGDLTGLVAVTFIFGGGTLFLLAISPIGKAIAARITGKKPGVETDDEIRAQLDAVQGELEDLRRLRGEVTELAERVDFAERLLARERDGARLPPAP
jgi:hypothetical protein